MGLLWGPGFSICPFLPGKPGAQYWGTSIVLPVGAEEAFSRDVSGERRAFCLIPTPHFSVPLPHSTAIPEGPKVSEMSRRDWHLPDIQGAQQGRHTQKVGWE